MKMAKLNEMVDRINLNPQWQGQLDPNKSLKRYIDVNDEQSDNWVREGADQDEQALADQENEQMSRGEALPPTPNITERHTQVHLERTQNADFASAPDEVKEIFDQHIAGENDQHEGGALKPTKGAAPRLAGPPAAPPAPTQGEGGNQV
jgi:hypothetical protein